MPALLPAEPGSYALHLRLPTSQRLVVGRLGVYDFPAGEYIYLGSARGPGGLRARLRHHLRISSRPRWHIDYLRQRAVVLGGWYSLSPGDLECDWSKALCRMPGAEIPAAGFGAADCKHGCPAHLVGFYGGLPLDLVIQALALPGQGLAAVLPFPVEIAS